MPIFRRDSETDDPPGTAIRERPVGPPTATGPQSRSRHTFIAPGTEMIGEITGATDVTLEGDLQGEVRIDGTVRVGPEGRVRGALEARVVEIGGRVKGDVRGRERIVLDASAELLGDLSAPRVEIHEGAFFKGAVEMTGGGGPKAGDRSGEERREAESAPKKTPPKQKSSKKEAPGGSEAETEAKKAEEAKEAKGKEKGPVLFADEESDTDRDDDGAEGGGDGPEGAAHGGDG